jgi:hypothetical protein
VPSAAAPAEAKDEAAAATEGMACDAGVRGGRCGAKVGSRRRTRLRCGQQQHQTESRPAGCPNFAAGASQRNTTGAPDAFLLKGVRIRTRRGSCNVALHVIGACLWAALLLACARRSSQARMPHGPPSCASQLRVGPETLFLTSCTLTPAHSSVSTCASCTPLSAAARPLPFLSRRLLHLRCASPRPARHDAARRRRADHQRALR